MGKSVKNVLGMMVAVVLVAAAVALPGCEDPAAGVYGVWRFAGIVGADADEAQKVAAVMSDQNMSVFFEFTPTTVAVHAIADGKSKSDTTNVKWESKGGNLFCKNPAGQGDATVTLVDENTIHWEKDSKAKGFILTRSSPTERETAMAGAAKK